MSDEKVTGSHFMGTYFDPGFVLKLSSVSKWLGWVVLAVYTIDFSVALLTMILQITRGFWTYMGFTDYATSILVTLERPFRGVVYAVVLLGISEVLKLFIDIENNTRRAARK
ncbi:MAG TPA: hypothetical protein VJZ78_02190 [Anaerolineales bacterium]|nr:hypothetical protein [Anaerolineales bacterium]